MSEPWDFDEEIGGTFALDVPLDVRLEALADENH